MTDQKEQDIWDFICKCPLTIPMLEEALHKKMIMFRLTHPQPVTITGLDA